MKYLIVWSLERLCGWLDKVYLPYRWEGRWCFGNGMLGCYYLGLAQRSAELEDRWHTGAWGSPK